MLFVDALISYYERIIDQNIVEVTSNCEEVRIYERKSFFSKHLNALATDLSALEQQLIKKKHKNVTETFQIMTEAFHTAKRTVPSILYIPGIDYFWKSAAPRLQSLFIRLVRDIDPSLPLLLLATCDSDPFVPLLLLTVRESDGEELPKQIADPFPETEHPCIFKVELPSKEEREVFFQQLLGLPPSNKTAVLSKRMRGENQEDSEQKLKQQKVSHSSSEEGSESELETGCSFWTHSSSGPEAVVSKRMRGENQEDSEQNLKQLKVSHSSSEEGSESELETGCIFLTHSSSGPEAVVSKRMRGENQEDSEQKLKQQKASHSSSEEGSESELETGCIFLTHSSSGPEGSDNLDVSGYMAVVILMILFAGLYTLDLEVSQQMPT
ncbi:uncharacterized protein LOC122797128 [Protopterus annectens]|uniref:uncharacterized protein LOC122797128 n=1 Tax=Protopterus annectens TaxID=7888 RepID=UPI001CFBFFC5|nr:uncharacterized protein LOC122797128 [Protopterus annectens]